MEKISKNYKNYWPGRNWMQRSHHDDGSNDCNANSMASGDFDNDQRADHYALWEQDGPDKKSWTLDNGCNGKGELQALSTVIGSLQILQVVKKL